MKRTLIVVALLSLASVAWAQDSAPPASSLRADDARNDARNQPLCLQETGTLIHRRARPSDAVASNQPVRATDCATAQPGRSWSRRDIERTGASNISDALRMLDPSVH